MRRLLEGLEAMCPEMIVVCGRLFTERASETESTEQFKSYVEALASMIRDLGCVNLRDHTHWVFVPSIDDAGQIKAMPTVPFSESFFAPLKSGPQRLKKLTLANNPCRISFLGKEIVVCRYNFTTRLKQNHHAKITPGQERAKQSHMDYEEKPDSYKVAKTVLKQGFLLPLPQIVQPILWSYGVDTLSLSPEPDFLVLADDAEDSYSKVSLMELNDLGTKEQEKFVHVVNPGNFAADGSFAVVYPFAGKVEPSKI